MKRAAVLPALIGISGKMGSGKDTLVSRLITFLSHECAHAPTGGITHLKFAMPLKKVVALVTGTSLDDNLHRKDMVVKRFGNKTLGQLQQEIGTYFRTAYDEDVWMYPVLLDALARCRSGAVVLISDVRFPNEADAICAAGGIVIRLVCPSDTTQDEARDAAHISETALDDYAFFAAIVENRKVSPDELLDAVLAAIAK